MEPDPIPAWITEDYVRWALQSTSSDRWEEKAPRPGADVTLHGFRVPDEWVTRYWNDRSEKL